MVSNLLDDNNQASQEHLIIDKIRREGILNTALSQVQ